MIDLALLGERAVYDLLLFVFRQPPGQLLIQFTSSLAALS
jgi:hypothetical protein